MVDKASAVPAIAADDGFHEIDARSGNWVACIGCDRDLWHVFLKSAAMDGCFLILAITEACRN
jgi:hypothetical protein